MEWKINESLNAVVARLGGPERVAELLGKSRQAVYNMIGLGKVHGAVDCDVLVEQAKAHGLNVTHRQLSGRPTSGRPQSPTRRRYRAANSTSGAAYRALGRARPAAVQAIQGGRAA